MSKPAALYVMVRKIVDDAKPRSVTSALIWGSLPIDVPRESLLSELPRMVRAGYLKRTQGPKVPGQRGDPPGLYLPGKNQVPAADGKPSAPRMLGNREMLRLLDARKAARAWKREASR